QLPSAVRQGHVRRHSELKVTILGCGGASGVPSINNGWGKCDPTNPRNRRRRASILVEEGGQTILIDTGPDLRAQLLDTGTRHIDSVLYTHAHADHLHGIDELRDVNRAMGGPIQVYAKADVLAEIKKRFGYAFAPPEEASFHDPKSNTTFIFRPM